MLKKLVVWLFIIMMWHLPARAEQGGQIILDLAEYDETHSPQLLEMGWNYIQDVKQYNNILEGETLNKDFTADIRSQYPDFDQEKAEFWQDSVRKGIKIYRWFEYWKKQFVDSILNQEMPLVVDDNQYEMGEDEQYIATDSPLIIHDFKKVVAYSDNPRDKLAAKEKIAKDTNTTRPSETIAKIKKALIEKDFGSLFGFDWRSFFDVSKPSLTVASSPQSPKYKSVILSEFDAFAPSQKIRAVIMVSLPPEHIMLLSPYQNYAAMKVDLSNSENLQNIQIHFTKPQQILFSGDSPVQIYNNSFAIYISAEPVDKDLSVIINAKISGNVCALNSCELINLKPQLILPQNSTPHETVYATYVRSMSQNVPNEQNKHLFDFGKAVFDNSDSVPHLRLAIEVSAPSHLDVMITGAEQKYFSKPQIRLENSRAIVRFDLTDLDYNPVGKEIAFWTSLSGNKQYIKTLKIEPLSPFDVQTNRFSPIFMLMAFIGGLLLNLMPCALPVIFLKLLSLTKPANPTTKQIKSEFAFIVLGIFVSVLIMAVIFAMLKNNGYNIGWGIQFQNTVFPTIMLWVVVAFFAYALGLLPHWMPKNKSRLLGFCTGIFIVLLSSSCMAPYLSTAMGVASAGSGHDMTVTFLFMGLGLAAPYILVYFFPSLIGRISTITVWSKTVNCTILIALSITMIWLICIIVAQTNLWQMFFWGIYICIGLGLLYAKKLFLNEVNKLSNREIAALLHKRYKFRFGLATAVVIILSIVTTSSAYQKHTSADTLFAPNLAEIKQKIGFGQKVLVKIDADWCLSCKYNNIFVFGLEHIKDAFENNRVELQEFDLTTQNPAINAFMKRFRRIGVPFYVLFSPKFSEGIVLPETITTYDLVNMIEM